MRDTNNMQEAAGCAPITVDALTPETFAAMIDHTFLKPFGKPADIERLCDEARRYGFAMVAVNPAETARCVDLLRGSGVRTGAAIGFPLGQNTSETKAFEIRDAIAKGAGEIDMVINLRALQSGDYELVQAELDDLAAVCRASGVISKVILETCYLNDDEKRSVCRMACAAGVDFVKTSTGFGTGGATDEDLKLMRAHSPGHVQVKAAGGVRTFDRLLEVRALGVTRCGATATVVILDECKKRLRG